jgi:LysM repeat protein
MLIARFLLAGSMALMVVWALLLGVVFRDPDLLGGGAADDIDVSIQLSAALVEIDELRGQVADLEAEVAKTRSSVVQTPIATDDETPVAGAPLGDDEASTEGGDAGATPVTTPDADATDVGPTGLPFLSDQRLTHEVVQGDSLYGIAARYGTTVEDLVAANHLRDAGSIRVGSLLIIP